MPTFWCCRTTVHFSWRTQSGHLSSRNNVGTVWRVQQWTGWAGKGGLDIIQVSCGTRNLTKQSSIMAWSSLKLCASRKSRPPCCQTSLVFVIFSFKQKWMISPIFNVEDYVAAFCPFSVTSTFLKVKTSLKIQIKVWYATPLNMKCCG